MKKLIVFFFAIALLIGISPYISGAKTKTTLHFFESAVCPSCKKADEYLNSPAVKNRFKEIAVIKYELINKEGLIGAINKKNIRILVAMLDAIKAKKGDAPFILRDRLEYQYYSKNGVPYHKREDRYSRKDEPLPVPLFLIDDKLYVGFNQYVMNELDKAVK